MKHLILPTIGLLAISLTIMSSPLEAAAPPSAPVTNSATAIAATKADASPGISLTVDASPTPAPNSSSEAAKKSDASTHNPGMGDVIEQIFEECGVPIGFFIMVGVIVWVNVSARERQRRITHETIRLMIEKGLPVPPELFIDRKVADQRIVRPNRDLRRGIVLIAAGIGVVAFFGVDHSHIWALGLIPLLMGVGYIIVWKIDRSQKIDGNPSQP
jgi:hypothetical protein